MQGYSVLHANMMTESLDSFWNQTQNDSMYSHESAVYVQHEIGRDYKSILSVWFVAIGALGFLANLLMLYLTRHSNTKRQLNEPVRTLRKDLMYFFIFNLAFSDAAGSLVGIPLVTLEAYKLTIKNNSVCRVVRFSQLLFPTVTLFLLLLITVERYLSIISPLYILRRSSARKIIYLAWIWSSAIICLGLPSFEIQRWELDKQRFTLVCKYSDSGERRSIIKILYLIFVLLAYLVPCFIVVTLSVYIASKILRKRLVLQDKPLAAITSESEKLKTTRVFLTVVAAFILPYLAYIIYAVCSMTGILPDNSYQTDVALRGILAALVYSNVVINPMVIFVEMKSLRLKLRATLGCQDQVQSLDTVPCRVSLQPVELSLQTF